MNCMKKLLVALVAITTYSTNGLCQTWTPKSDIPINSISGSEGRFNSISFTLSGKLYVGGGIGKYVTASTPAINFNDFYEYDPGTDKWTRKADLPGATSRASGTGFAINNKGYIGLGVQDASTTNSKYLSDLWEYDPATDKWSQKASLPQGELGGMATFVVNNKAYLVGGNTSDASGSGVNDLWEYDPATDKWAKKADYPNAEYISGPYAFTVNGKGYVAAGGIRKILSDPFTNIKTTYEYDPIADKWTKKADFPGNVRGYGLSFVLNNIAFCGLGTEDFVMFYTDFYEYDAATDTWKTSNTVLPTTIKSRIHEVSGVISNKVYIGGGWSFTGSDHEYYKDFFEFTHPVAIGDINHNGSLDVVYPNPTNGLIYVKSKTKYAHYKLYSLTGTLIAQGDVSDRNTIDFGKLAAGMYMLKICNQNSADVNTFTIQVKQY